MYSTRSTELKRLAGIAQEGLLQNYLRLRPLVLSNTLSQMWDRLNLPMLLFKRRVVNPDVMDRQDYINKANQLLNQNTYKVISKDPHQHH